MGTYPMSAVPVLVAIELFRVAADPCLQQGGREMEGPFLDCGRILSSHEDVSIQSFQGGLTWE